MKIYSQLKTLALLCALPASSTFAAEPAKPYEALAKYGQAVIPASLQAELKRIEDLPDHKVLTEVVPAPIDKAERLLRKSEDVLKDSPHSLVSAQAKTYRSDLKCLAIKKELTSCPDGVLKQTLQSKLNEAGNQSYAHRQEEQRCADDYIENKPFAAYNFMVHRYDALANQASILLARTQNLEKEKAQLQKEKAQLQQEKAQSQQREQVLQAALNGYQLLEDGLQIEGVPNVPGGVKPKLKRSGSF